MQRSIGRIHTTHVGALPRPDELLALNAEAAEARLRGDGFDEHRRQSLLRQAVKDVVRKQTELGIDIPNDGEFGKAMRARVDYGAWLSYVFERLSGWEQLSQPLLERPQRPGDLAPRPFAQRRDRRAFADFYAELDREFFGPGTSSATRLSRAVTGPIGYRGHAALQADLDNLRSAVAEAGVAEAFVTSIAPGSFGREQNRYYPTQEAFLFGIAEAMRVEYRAIVDAGFVLQIDDPGIAENWDAMDVSVSIDDYRHYARMTVAALNHALDGIPEDRVRYHLCWGSWHGPHVTDLPLSALVDVLLEVRASAFLVEAGNPRHEHEWKVWRDVRALPAGRLLVPGVVSHATNIVEHPEVVADRLVRYAEVVGRENVIAGTDCGLGGRVHPTLAWAKLQALAEGASLASERLWP